MQRVIYTLLITTVLAGSAFAQAAGEGTVLDEVFASAGRTEGQAEKTGRAFTVIDGEQLEAYNNSDVADVLRQVPGFQVSRQGAVGGVTQVRARGAEANQLLVLIDGVEAGSPNDGEFDFGGLQVENVERIEILRGPQSAFWGSNASAGVVNIITRGGIRNGTEAYYKAEGGSYGSALLSFGIRGGGETYDAAVSASFRRTDGFNTSRFGDENDGDRNLTLNGKWNWDITEQLRLDGNIRYVTRESEYDDVSSGVPLDSDQYSDVSEWLGGVGLTWDSLDGAWTHTVRFDGSDSRRVEFTDGLSTSGSEGDRIRFLAQSTYRFDMPGPDASHLVTVGYEWERQRFASIEPESDPFGFFDPSQGITQERDQQSLVAEYRGEFGGDFFLNGAIRHDFNDEFDDATTFSVGASYVVSATQTRFHTSIGTGVTNPSFFEQFGFVPANFLGNPNLQPEESFGWDIGVEQTWLGGRLVTDITYFNQRLRDEIVSTFDFNTFLSSVENLDGTSRRQGVELSARAQITDNWSAVASYSYIDSEDPDGEQEIRRPNHIASLRSDYTFLEGNAKVFGEVLFNGKADDLAFTSFPATRVSLDSYTLVNIGGSYKLSEHAEIYGRINNLLDEDYSEVFGYNSPGITAIAGIKGSF